MSSSDVAEALDMIHHFSSGVYAKQVLIRQGMYAEQHIHKYDHLSILASGTVLLEVDGDAIEKTGPACLTIRAGSAHKITALTDAVWFCIHATDETDPSLVDEVILKG